MKKLVLVLCVFIGCGSESTNTEIDAPTVLPSTCTGACTQVDLNINFGSASGQFDRGFFGFTSPANSESGQWEIYVEASSGDDNNCPTMESPTPENVLTIAGHLPPSLDSSPGTSTFVDFDGTYLMDSILEHSITHEVTWVAAGACLACSQGMEPNRNDRMVALELNATFDGGAISGHLYATHCESLDTVD